MFFCFLTCVWADFRNVETGFLQGIRGSSYWKCLACSVVQASSCAGMLMIIMMLVKNGVGGLFVVSKGERSSLAAIHVGHFFVEGFMYRLGTSHKQHLLKLLLGMFVS